MALACYQGVVQDSSGNAQASPTIEVRRESDNGLATLFSDRAGSSALGNSFTGNADGTFRFYVVAAEEGYKITATKDALTITLRNVAIGLMQEADAPDTQGTWTPTLDFFSPGTASISYPSRVAEYQVVNGWVHAWFNMTVTLTKGTASGQVTIGGLPFPAFDDFIGTLIFQGIHKSDTTMSPPVYYTQFALATAAGFSAMAIECSNGAGSAISNIQASNMIDGVGAVILRGNIHYKIDT